MTAADAQGITIRPLQLGDTGWIIHRHAVAIAPQFGWGIEFEELCTRVMAEFLKVRAEPSNSSWVVEREGRILGSLLLMREDELTARLRLLYVEDEARRLGLATTLLKTALEFARNAQYQRVILFTTGSNLAARRIYMRLGLAIIAEEPLHFAGKQEKGETWEIKLS